MTVSIAKSDLPDDLSQWEEMEIVEEAGTPSEHADTFYRYDNYGIEEHEGGTYQAYVIVPGDDGEEPVMVASGFDSPEAVISYLKGLMGKKELTAGEGGSGIIIELTGETPAFDKKSSKKDEKECEDEECEDDKGKEDEDEDEDEKKKKKGDEKIEKAEVASETANGSTTEQAAGATPTQDKVEISEQKAGKVQEAPEAGVAKSASTVADTLNTIKKACERFQSPSGFQKAFQATLLDKNQDWNKQKGKEDSGKGDNGNKKGKDTPPVPPKNKTATLDEFSGKNSKPSKGDANRQVSDDYGMREKDMPPSPHKGWSQKQIDTELMPYIDEYYPKDPSRSALPPIDSWPSKVREDYNYAVRNSGLDTDLLREYLGAMLNDPRYREPEIPSQPAMNSSTPQLTHDPAVEEMARYKEQHPSQLMMDSYEPQFVPDPVMEEMAALEGGQYSPAGYMPPRKLAPENHENRPTQPHDIEKDWSDAIYSINHPYQGKRLLPSPEVLPEDLQWLKPRYDAIKARFGQRVAEDTVLYELKGYKSAIKDRLGPLGRGDSGYYQDITPEQIFREPQRYEGSKEWMENEAAVADAAERRERARVHQKYPAGKNSELRWEVPTTEFSYRKSFKDALSSANDAKTAIKIRRHKMLKSDRVATGLKYPTTNIGTDRDASGYLAGYEVPKAENVKDDSMNSETEMKKAYYEPLPSFRRMMELKKAGLPYDVPPEADGADAPADGSMGAGAPAEGAGAPAADVPPVDAGAGAPAEGAGAPGDEDVEAAAQQIADSLKQLPPDVLAKVKEYLNEEDGGDTSLDAPTEEPEEDIPPAA